MKRTTIIFDFDGTIADSFKTMVEVYNEIGQEFHLKKLTMKEALSLRNFTPRQVVRALQISLFTLPLYLLRGRALFKKHADTIQPFPGMISVLQNLSSSYSLGILTSNNKDSVETFLTNHKIRDLFDFVHSERNIFGKDKALGKVLKLNNLVKEDVLYVGDEVRDIEACKKAGIKIASVSWGLNTKKLLEKYSPDYLYSKPEELLKL